MKKILIDLNILIDFLNKRNDHFNAAKIIDYCIANKIKGFLCAHEVTTLAYFLGKQRHTSAKSTISRILDIFSVLSITEVILKEAFYSRIKNYEDAVIESSCIKNGVDYIISRNLKDFEYSRVMAISPREYITKYELLLGTKKNSFK